MRILLAWLIVFVIYGLGLGYALMLLSGAMHHLSGGVFSAWGYWSCVAYTFIVSAIFGFAQAAWNRRTNGAES